MSTEKAGRNDPCPCGSGKKYKKCCLEKDVADARAQAQAAQQAAEAQRQAEIAARQAEHERAIQEASQARPQLAEVEPEPDQAEPDWPPLGPADQQIVDQWWDRVGPVYLKEREQPQREDWLLRQTIEFLDQQPRLFRYLYLYDEFLFELGADLARAGRMSDYVALLLQLRQEQPETFEQCFGYYERDILTGLLRTGRRAEIPQCFALFHRYPDRELNQRQEITELLAWQGLEPELAQFLELFARQPASDQETAVYHPDLRWRNDLAMLPFLQAGDTSPEARAKLRETLLAIGLWKPEDLIQKDWINRQFNLALLPPAEAGLDLKRQKADTYFEEVAWSFSGWGYRHKALPWSCARFLGRKLLDYWYWMEQKTKRKSLHLEAKELDSYLAKTCRDFFWLSGVPLYATLQAMVYLTEYLAAQGYFSAAEANRLQADYARLFQQAQPGVEAGDPAAQLYPSFQALIQRNLPGS